MNRTIDTKFGFLKMLLCGLVFLLGCHLNVYADPSGGIITGLLISLAISAATTAASIGLQILFAPKPKPQDKNKLQGDIQLTGVGEDIPILEPYGASLGDGIGGIKLGGTVFYASSIRKVVVTVPGGGGGGGGGKGAPKSPPTREHHYYIDLAILVGRGPLRVKQIKANTDLLYQSFTPVSHVFGITYEAEDADTTAGGVGSGSDADFDYATLPVNASVQWNTVNCTDASNSVEMFIVYKSSVDVDIEVTVNGSVQLAVLPASFNLPANINLPQLLNVGAANVIKIKNLTAVTLKLDRIVVGEVPIHIPGDDPEFPGDPQFPTYLSGNQYMGWQNPEPTYNFLTLRNPLDADTRGSQQWNYQSNPNTLGEITANIVNNGTVRIYEGNKTQLPDPMLQGYFEARYGAGSTPAHRGRCFVVLENFEITKYGSVPNFTFVAEHATVNSLGELYADRSLRAGLLESEFDYTDLNAVPLRGFAISQKQAPAREMELLNRIFDVDVYEDFDGIIKGVIPGETLDAEIPIDELGSMEGGSEGGDKRFAPVHTTFRDETELPYFFDVSFFDASADFETRNVHSIREVETSDRKQNIETGLVMTEAEAQKFADRELHKLYVEKDGLQVSLFHKHTYLAPTNKIQVEDVDGSTPKMRIKMIEGWIPGKLDVRGVSRDSDEYPPRVFVIGEDAPVVPDVSVPAPIIGTFLDMATFREEQTTGFYVAACLTDQQYQWGGAGLFREIVGDDWEALDGIPNQAVMGRTISGAGGTLADVPGGWASGNWDTVSEVTIDMYFGELETLTEAQVLTGRNFIVIGNELIQFQMATKLGGFPNRWKIENLRRRGSGTASAGHAAEERAVLYTEAWRWITQDAALANVMRTYKFVGSGGDLDTASSVDFNWNGQTQYNSPIYTTIDANVPTVTTAPVVSEEGGYWIINIQRPSAFGYSATIAEVRIRKTSDDTLVRQVDIGNTVMYSIIAQAFNCKVDYRWRNAYRLNGSDGWSTWSNIASVTAGAVNPPPDENPGGGGGDPGDIEPICFIDGTLVLMADWSEKPIEWVEAGDVVMAWNEAGRLLPCVVKAVMPGVTKEYRDLVLTDDRLGVTEKHPFRSNAGRKVSVEDMETGLSLSAYDRGWTEEKVKFVDRVPLEDEIRVTNFEVDKAHTYFVRGSKNAKWKAVYNRKYEY